MPLPLLKTKLYPPPPRATLVTRPRLVERLNAGLQPGRQLILICAAAGFGKSTLAGEWIAAAHLDSAVAWISLDDEDNNPIRFFNYLIAALQQVDPRIGENLDPLLQSPQPPPPAELTAQLINQISASSQQILLMLDDYHLINSDAVQQIVLRLIERQPSQLRMVILTREDPSLPLPRLRVRGQVIEIRERDLRFTLAEAQAFLVEAMGLGLSEAEVGKLKDRTEGWAAGMQLAALALEDVPDEENRRAFIDAFTGSDRFIVDYLVSEVLERQPEPVREFLYHTSVLERFCSELCDQVVYGQPGAGKSQPILDALEQGNMFLVSLDNQRQWYRYHHLFNEMLCHYLRRSDPECIPELQRRASAWCESKGLVTEAVKYALAAADWPFAIGLLHRYAMSLIMQSQSSLVVGWCRALPKDVLAAAPEVCIFYAWGLVLTFRNDYLDAVEEKLVMAERALENPDLPECALVGQDGARVPLRDWALGQICVIRSQILLGHFYTRIDPQELIALSLRGLDLLPEAEKAIRALCRINLAHAELMQNHPVEAQQAFEDCLPFMIEARNYVGGVTCIFYRARLAYYMGDLEGAEALCRRWKEEFVELAGASHREVPTIRGLDVVLSIVLMERGLMDEAERLLQHALELQGWATWMELVGFIALARLRFLRGDRAGADETLATMFNLGPQHVRCAEALQILFQIRTDPGDLRARAQAEAWVGQVSPDPGAPLALGIGPYHRDVEYFCNLAWAQIQLALGRPELALTFVRPALDLARQHRLTFRVLELTLTLALLLDALGEPTAALAELDKALEIAERHGYARVFSEAPRLDRLLRQAAEGDRRAGFARRVLASLERTGGTGQPMGASAAPAALLVEPLSERELEVLGLIAGGLSNEQIAERLYIAQGTVKRHITNLYGKLAVQSRTQAVARARELGLLG